jgi:DNA polymerase-3 subunit delta
MTPEQLRRSLAKGAAPAYFFSGPETGLKKAAVDAIIALVPEPVRAFNVQVFHAFEDEMADVLTAARTLPFMAARRVVVLRDIEKTRLDQAGRGDMLAEYLAKPEPMTAFVVTTEEEERAKTLGKRHADHWVHVEFRALQGEALEKALRAEVRRLGCSIDDEALKALLEATGADLARAGNELEKLRVALGAGGAIDTPAVRLYVAGYEHRRVNDITDAVGRRDLAGALRLLREIAIDDKEFLGLLGQLGKRLRVLWYLTAPAAEVPKVFNVAWQLQQLRSDARHFTRGEIERGLEGLRELDERAKSTAVAPKLLLEHFLLGFLPRQPGSAGR